MKCILLTIVGFAATLLLAGCGQHADGMSGSLDVTATKISNTGYYGIQAISGTVQYKHPTRTNFLGLKINILFPDNTEMAVVCNESGAASYLHYVTQSTIQSYAGPVVAQVDKVTGFSNSVTIDRLITKYFEISPPDNNAATINQKGTFEVGLTLPVNGFALYTFGGFEVTGATVELEPIVIGTGCSLGVGMPSSIPLEETLPPGYSPNPIDAGVNISFDNFSGTTGYSRTCTVFWKVHDTAVPTRVGVAQTVVTRTLQ